MNHFTLSDFNEDLNLQASLKLTPKASRIVPTPLLEALGNRLLVTVMKASVDPYVTSLEQDYYSWANSQERTLLVSASSLP